MKIRTLSVLGLLPWALLLFSGCSGRNPQESAQGLELAKLLRSIKQETETLQGLEQSAANELRITLDQAGKGDVRKFQAKIQESVRKLTDIRCKRQLLLDKVAAGQWDAAFVRIVQNDVITMFKEDQARITSWIQLSQNRRQREDLGEEREFPEVARLKRLLDLFTGQTPDEPLVSQIRSIQTEYGLADRETGR